MIIDAKTTICSNLTLTGRFYFTILFSNYFTISIGINLNILSRIYICFTRRNNIYFRTVGINLILFIYKNKSFVLVYYSIIISFNDVTIYTNSFCTYCIFSSISLNITTTYRFIGIKLFKELCIDFIWIFIQYRKHEVTLMKFNKHLVIFFKR